MQTTRARIDGVPLFSYLRLMPAMALLGSSCARMEKEEIAPEVDFERLVAMTKRYDLPTPPREAALVLAASDGTSLIKNHSTSLDPGIYTPAFLIKDCGTTAVVWQGWSSKEVESRADYRPALRPFSLQEPKPKKKGYVADFRNGESLIAAIHLAQRGEQKSAQALMAKLAKEDFLFTDFGRTINTSDRENSEVLAIVIYEYAKEESSLQDSDWKKIHRRLLRLRREFPDLFSKNETDYVENQRQKFAEDLGEAVRGRRARSDVERQLVKWGQTVSEMRHLGMFSQYTVQDDQPARSIINRGLAAMPELERLSSDRRLTRQFDHEATFGHPRRWRVGDLASYLLDKMKGSQAGKKGVPSGNERRFFEMAAVTVEGGEITKFHEVPLRILGRRHPESLLAFCQGRKGEFSTQCGFSNLAEAVVEARLQRHEKSEALEALYREVGENSNRRSILQLMAEVDQPKTIQFLRPVLAKLPRTTEDPYWLCEEAGYTHVVMQLDDDGIWNDYLAVVKKSEVGLRLEQMDSLAYLYVGQKNRNRRIKFLAAFLNDKETRSLKAEGGKSSGPSAAFTFPKIQVRNFAAMNLALLLKLDEDPNEFWKRRDWKRLRERVRAALQAEGFDTP